MLVQRGWRSGPANPSARPVRAELPDDVGGVVRRIEALFLVDSGGASAQPQDVFHKVGAKTADALGGHRQRALVQVIELYRAALADKAGMTVPGVVGASECQQGSPAAEPGRRNPRYPPRAQHTQLAVRVIPFSLKYTSTVMTLLLWIGVDIAVGPLTEFAHGNRGGQGGQVHIKAARRASLRRRAPASSSISAPNAGPYCRFPARGWRRFQSPGRCVDPRQHLGAQKPGHKPYNRRIGMQFRPLDRFEIDQRHRGILVGALPEHRQGARQNLSLIVRQIDVNSAGNRHRTADAATGLCCNIPGLCTLDIEFYTTPCQ